MRSKRGSLQDVFYISLMLFITGLVFIMASMAYSRVNAGLQQQDLGDTAKNILNRQENRQVKLYDGIFLMVLLLLWIVAIVLAFQIDSNPIFFFISIFIYVALIIVCAVLANAFYAVTADSNIVDEASKYVIIPMVMNHFVETMVFIGFTVGLVMWAKSQNQGAF